MWQVIETGPVSIKEPLGASGMVTGVNPKAKLLDVFLPAFVAGSANPH